MEIDELLESIGKRQGTTKLTVIESIPVITAVEGDYPDMWHLCVHVPYRGLQYGKQSNEWEVLKQLRKAKQQYERLARQVQREIDIITGEPEKEL